jgi:hypothetical protein
VIAILGKDPTSTQDQEKVMATGQICIEPDGHSEIKDQQGNSPQGTNMFPHGRLISMETFAVFVIEETTGSSVSDNPSCYVLSNGTLYRIC